MEKELVGKYTMPGIGFGTLGNTGDAGSVLVEAALAEGYRYIDTSRYYGNEEAVGKALARSSAERTVRTQTAENVAAIAMKEIRDGAEDFPLRALARAGRAEDENRPVFHKCDQ